MWTVFLRSLKYRVINNWKGVWGREKMVGIAGFEPATPDTPWQCATKLRHIPTSIAIVRVFIKKSISFCLFGYLLRKRLILSACARSFTRLYSLFNHWLIVLYISSRSIGWAVLLGCKLSFCISSLLPATLSTKNGIKCEPVALLTLAKLSVNILL